MVGIHLITVATSLAGDRADFEREYSRNVKIMLLYAVSQRVCDAGADAWSRDAGDAVSSRRCSRKRSDGHEREDRALIAEVEEDKTLRRCAGHWTTALTLSWWRRCARGCPCGREIRGEGDSCLTSSSAEIFKEAIALIEPRLKSDSISARGTWSSVPPRAISTISARTSYTMLRCNGYEVHDLGVDVPRAFVEKAADRVGMTLFPACSPWPSMP